MQETWETWVWSLGREGPLEKETATHSSVLAWRTHGQTSLAGYSEEDHKDRTRLKRLSTACHHLSTTPDKPTPSLFLLLVTKPQASWALYIHLLHGSQRQRSSLTHFCCLCALYGLKTGNKGAWVLNASTSLYGVLVGTGSFLSTL